MFRCSGIEMFRSSDFVSWIIIVSQIPILNQVWHKWDIKRIPAGNQLLIPTESSDETDVSKIMSYFCLKM